MKKTAVLFTMLAAFACQLSFAQSNSSSATADTATMNFISNATAANLKEILTGKLAGKKAKDPMVKAFGEKMVDHHKMATKQMAALVKSKGIKVSKPPLAVTAPDSSLINSTGADFDRIYVTMMIADHQKTIALFENASKNLSDPDFKAFALKTLPMLKGHLAEIQTIAQKTNISAAQ